jgi:hypothetical protein
MINSNKTKDPTNKYYNMTKEEIKQQWANKAKTSSESGTNTHYNIECYYNEIPVDDESIEFKYFMDYVNNFPNLKPYRTEWLIYDEELKITGSIDMVYENDDGTLTIRNNTVYKTHSRHKLFSLFVTIKYISNYFRKKLWKKNKKFIFSCFASK